jgi:hypothetical protein
MDIDAFDCGMLRGLHPNLEPSIPLEDADNVSHGRCLVAFGSLQHNGGLGGTPRLVLTWDRRGVQGVPNERQWSPGLYWRVYGSLVIFAIDWVSPPLLFLCSCFALFVTR